MGQQQLTIFPKQIYFDSISQKKPLTLINSTQKPIIFQIRQTQKNSIGISRAYNIIQPKSDNKVIIYLKQNKLTNPQLIVNWVFLSSNENKNQQIKILLSTIRQKKSFKQIKVSIKLPKEIISKQLTIQNQFIQSNMVNQYSFLSIKDQTINQSQKTQHNNLKNQIIKQDLKKNNIEIQTLRQQLNKNQILLQKYQLQIGRLEQYNNKKILALQKLEKIADKLQINKNFFNDSNGNIFNIIDHWYQLIVQQKQARQKIQNHLSLIHGQENGDNIQIIDASTLNILKKPQIKKDILNDRKLQKLKNNGVKIRKMEIKKEIK